MIGILGKHTRLSQTTMYGIFNSYSLFAVIVRLTGPRLRYGTVQTIY